MTIKPEFWVLVPGRDDYMVSNTGKIKSYHRQWRRWIDKSLREDSKGYLSVGISSGTKSTSSARVHRLVAAAFIPNPNNLPYINHKDNNPKNNDVSNLEWCDPKYNMEYSFFSGNRVSGQAKPVRLFVDGKFFSNYSSVEHCSLSISKNKKFFNLAVGKTKRLEGMFKIEPIKRSELLREEPLNRKVLKHPLGKTSSKPVLHGDTPYYSIQEVSDALGLKYGRVRQTCDDGRYLLGLPLKRISLSEYVRKSKLINEKEDD